MRRRTKSISRSARRAAALLIVSSITGIAVLVSLPKRRGSGLVAGLVGLTILVVVYAIWVPR
jgi:hypothetical protein